MSIEHTQTASAESRGEAWLEAVKILLDLKDSSAEAFHFVVEVKNPSQSTPRGRRIEKAVDSFLRKRGSWPLQTVAETLFPASEYLRNGVTGVYEYPEAVYPFIRDKNINKWGTYAHRLLHREGADGNPFNPLEQCIGKLKKELARERGTIRTRYEIDIVDSGFDLSAHDVARDGNHSWGNLPCMSHVGFQVRDHERLLLAATYRNHYYVERLLGNLLGLAQLQRFVCDQTGLEPGALVCLSSLAKVDAGSRWRKSDVKALVKHCEEIE